MSRSGFTSKRAAQEALRALRALEDAEIAEVHGLLVGTYLRQWLDGKRTIRPTTQRAYGSHIQLYLEPHLSRVLLADLRPHHLDAMYRDLLSGARTAVTVRRIHATLRSALNSAVKRRLIPWNPALHIELPAGDKHRTTVWTPRQYGQFLDATSNHRLYALFHLVGLTGLRRGEALGLRWTDVDLERGVLSVEQQLVDSGGRLYFGPPKTRSGTRVVPLDDGTREVLRDHFDRQSAEQRAWGAAWKGSGLVFAKENGEQLRPDYVTHLFRRLTLQAQLPPIRLHDLRHTSASLALSAGVPMKVVSERLGHSSSAITADLYTHVAPVLAQDAADRIASVIPGGVERSARQSTVSSTGTYTTDQYRYVGDG